MLLCPFEIASGFFQVALVVGDIGAAHRGERRIGRIRKILAQRIGNHFRVIDALGAERVDERLVLRRRFGCVARTVRLPLLPAEDEKKAERDADRDRHRILAQPFLYELALLVFVKNVKSHEISAE